MHAAFRLLAAALLLGLCSAQTVPYSPGRGGTALTPTALEQATASQQPAPAPDASRPEPALFRNDDGSGGGRGGNGPPPYTVLAAIIVGAGLCISVIVCLCVRRLAVITHSRRLAQASDVSELRRRRTRAVAMTALGRYSATQDAEKPLAPVHVVVMPDKSISFGVELTGTGDYVSSDLAVEGPAAEAVAAAGELSSHGGRGTIFAEDVTEGGGGGGGDDSGITISRFRVHRPPPPDWVQQAIAGAGAPAHPGANAAAAPAAAPGADPAAAAVGVGLGIRPQAAAAGVGQGAGPASGALPLRQTRAAGAWQQLARGSSRIMYGSGGSVGPAAQAAALERASSREAAQTAGRELSGDGSTEGSLHRGSPPASGRGGGGGGRGSMSGSAGGQADGRSGGADGGGGGVRPGDAAASSDGSRHAPAGAAGRLSSFTGTTTFASEPAAAAGPAATGPTAARVCDTGAPLAGGSRRSLSAPPAADADSSAPTLQPRLSGDLRQRYGLPGDSPPGPPPGAAGWPAQSAAGAGPNERQIQ